MNSAKKLINNLKMKFHNATIRHEKWFRTEALNLNSSYIDGRHYSANIENQKPLAVDISHRKDILVEQILDKCEYNFKNALFIINPFEFSPLTALLIFNTDTPCKVEYTVRGMRGSSDYTKCDEALTTRHQVPILGMYTGAINSIKVCLLDKNDAKIASTNIRFRLPRAGTVLKKCLVNNKKSNNTLPLFTMATGGYSMVNYMFDNNMNIRWYLTAPVHPYGIHIMGNGHLLVPDKRMRRPNYGNAHSVVAYEMDWLGRVHHIIYHPSGFHHWATTKENDGNMLIGTSSRYDTYMENSIDELDINTGESIRMINANNIFDNTYVTRYDWAHVNSFEYIPEEDAVIVSYRNIHTIAKISMATGEIIWILANPDFYKNTEQSGKVLLPSVDIKWFFQQHGVQIIKRVDDGVSKKITIALFDNHTANRRPVKYFDNKKESNIMIFTIDEKNYTVTMDKCIPVPLSITRSNIELDIQNRRIYAMCANIKDDKISCRAKILGFDYDTEECICDISCENDFFIAKFVEPDLKTIQSSINNKTPLCLGELYKPEKADKMPDDFSKAQEITEEIKKQIQFVLNGNIIQIRCKDHDIQKVYLYNNENIYIQSFDDTEQLTKIFKEHVYHISIPLESLQSGKYNIGIKYQDNNYNTYYFADIR